MRRYGFLVLVFFLLSCAIFPIPLDSELPAGTVQPRPTLLPPLPTTQRTPFSLRCPPTASPLITHLDVLQYPDLPEPAPLQPFRDPVFGTCLVRVTDRSADPAADDNSKGMKNEYSRVQSFNADGSRLLVRSLEANWYLYDVARLQMLARLPLVVEPRWDAADPDLIYHFDETRLVAYHIRYDQQELLHDFAQDFPGENLAAVWTRYEGSPTSDTRRWGLIVQDSNWQAIAFIIYDRVQDQIVAKLPVEKTAVIDNVTISPLGNYFLASFDYCEHGSLGSNENPCGLMVYDGELRNPRGLLRIIGHYDTALDAQGNEVIIYQDIDADAISMLDLATGQVTPLFPIDFSHTPLGFHFSGRGFQLPGWALVSTYSGGFPTAYTWMDNSVFAVELKAGGRVVRLAHTHSIVDETQEHDYWAEPQASASPDFLRILFTTNWGRTGADEVEMVLIELPPDWAANLDQAP